MTMTRTGPNDASCVVWAIGEFFLFYFVFFNTKLLFYCKYRFLCTKYATGRMVTTITGLNDASRVVWTIGKYYFILFVFFCTKTYFYCIYRLYTLNYAT